MQARYAIIALDINKFDPRFKIYNDLSATEKVAHIVHRIKQLCVELERKEPHAMWIVAWGEYGITNGFADADPYSKTVNNDLKFLLKKELGTLTTQYPNLTIIAGTVSTKRHFDNFIYNEKLQKIEAAYREHVWINEIENKRNETPHLRLHTEKLHKIKELALTQGIDVVRNTSYIFQNIEVRGEATAVIQRHDKVAPFNEANQPNAVFQPGKDRNKNPYMYLIHPITKEEVYVGIEICREHDVATLRQVSPDKKTRIHFILSEGMRLDSDAMHGQYLIQLDKQVKPQLILSEDTPLARIPIHLYQNNLLDPSGNTLSLPLQPLHPFENKILAKLDSSLSSQLNEDTEEMLKLIRTNCVIALTQTDAAQMYALLDFCLNDLHEMLDICEQSTDIEIIKALRKDIESIIVNEKINNPSSVAKKSVPTIDVPQIQDPHYKSYLVVLYKTRACLLEQQTRNNSGKGAIQISKNFLDHVENAVINDTLSLTHANQLLYLIQNISSHPLEDQGDRIGKFNAYYFQLEKSFDRLLANQDITLEKVRIELQIEILKNLYSVIKFKEHIDARQLSSPVTAKTMAAIAIFSRAIQNSGNAIDAAEKKLMQLTSRQNNMLRNQ